MSAVTRFGLAGLLVFALSATSVEAQQQGKSAALAKELTAALDAAKLDAVAAKDPQAADMFVGALYFPGTQLLVVSAKYAAPLAMNEQLAKKNYRDVYLDLTSASVAGTKIFVTDLGANGLVAEPDDNQPFDTFDQGGKSTTFNKDWDEQKMSEADYKKAFAEADAQYSQMLSALLAQVKKS
jgi:hypothetical protein